MNRRAGAVLCGGALVVAVGFGACSVDSGPRIHDDRDGVLSANSGSGGQGLNPPRGKRRWSGTFGSFLLCVTEPGARAELSRIRYAGDPEPASVTFLLRRVPEKPKRTEGLMWMPIGSALGTWPSFSFGRAAGTAGPVRDAVIDQRCDTGGDESGFTELLVQIESGPKGGRLQRLYVDYTVDGKPQTLRIRWQLVMCGSATTDVCDDEAAKSAGRVVGAQAISSRGLHRQIASNGL